MASKELFTLIGYVTSTLWGGGKGWKKLIIKTDLEGLEEIKNNPLQDYIGFGVQSIDYAFFEVYKKVIIEKRNVIETKEYKEPLFTIEQGKYSLTPEQEEFLLNDYDEAIVNY